MSCACGGQAAHQAEIKKSYLFPAFFTCVLQMKNLLVKSKIGYISAKQSLVLAFKEDKYLENVYPIWPRGPSSALTGHFDFL